MPLSAESHLCTRLKLLSHAAAISAILIALLVLIGWGFRLEPLKRILPEFVPMNPVTALCFIFAGSSLYACRLGAGATARKFARTCALLILAAGVLGLSADIFRWDFLIDQIFFRSWLFEPETQAPNRMAPNTALNFTLLGCALLFIDRRIPRLGSPAPYLCLLAALLSLLALAGYAFKTTVFYRVGGFVPMALPTAFTFLILSLGIVFARPADGLMKILTTDGVGAATARRLLPTAIFLPLILGWLRLQGEKQGLYDASFGVSLMAVCHVLIFTALIWWNAALLNRAEEQQEHLFNVSLDLLCIAGSDGYFKRLNPVWEKTLGFTTQELLARPYLEFIHPDDRQATIAEAEKLSLGVKVLTFENRYQCKDGTWRWFQWNAAPLPESQLIYAAARDVTERKQADQQIEILNQDLQRRAAQLEAANKELEAFSYSVSHDLRAPLRHISGFLQLIQKSASSTLDAKNQHYLKMISESADEMGRLVDDLLAFSRMGRAEMRLASVPLTPLVREAINDLAPDTAGRSVDWKIHPLPDVQADAALLRQVLLNLFSNALKYSRPRARAEIEIGVIPSLNGEDIIFIRDNGVGFDMQYAGKLFGVFQRLHDSDQFEGTGIGLANVHRIVARHGGRTWAEGVVDGGATFYFSLPKLISTNHELIETHSSGRG